jgi:hypothetical protein
LSLFIGALLAKGGGPRRLVDPARSHAQARRHDGGPEWQNFMKLQAEAPGGFMLIVGSP